jgi:hypothetical protein
MQRIIPFFLILLFLALACNGGAVPTVPPTPQTSVFDLGRTTYGFFPSPPEAKLESVLQMYKDISDHGDFVLIQQNTKWEDFVTGVDGESQTRTDMINQVILARQNNIDYIFVTDALNGLNRREFAGLPAGWEARFANPDVRAAYKNFALWIVRQFHPRYLGLASEINTYMDAHPDDAPSFISLYNEIYTAVKAEAPDTQIFVTFQWDDLNNMFPQPEEGDRQKFDVNWEQMEAFEPNLDLWVISSYPYFVFPSGADIPTDYYTPLLLRTSKPVAVAEGGYTTRSIGNMVSSPQDQVAYLEAIHNQLGPRLTFWVNTVLSDFNLDSYSEFMLANGQTQNDVTSLSYFAFIGLREFSGTPKPALELWDGYRAGE